MKGLAPAVGLVLLSQAGSFAQSHPPLAEIARREAERRKAVATPAKVYTNADVGRAPLTTGSVVAPAPDAEAAKTESDAAKAAEAAQSQEPPKDEAYWRSRITEARQRLERNELFLEALQSRINALTNDFAARDDPAQRALIGADRIKALAEMERVKTENSQLAKSIADIEEEARREGVPPGWLR
jgi:hypothetical protein